MSPTPKFRLLAAALSLAATSRSLAGMASYDLTDIARMRLEEVSFFALVLGLSALGIKALWNAVARDWSALPRISWGRALALTVLLSMLMLLVLSMISGARELLTPGAWRRQGTAYKLNEAAEKPVRRAGLEALRVALFDYAEMHGGSFPPNDFVREIPEKLWQSPDSAGTHFVYLGGMRRDGPERLLACEPLTFGDARYALLTSGEIKLLPTGMIHALVAPAEKEAPP